MGESKYEINGTKYEIVNVPDQLPLDRGLVQERLEEVKMERDLSFEYKCNKLYLLSINGTKYKKVTVPDQLLLDRGLIQER